MGSIYRYDRPQAGRYREFHQFNLEAIGEADAWVDVEVVQAAWHLLTSLGFRSMSLELNSIGCPQCRPRYMEALVDYYQRRVEELCPDCRRRLGANPLRLLDCKNEACQALVAEAPHSTEHLDEGCRDHFEEVKHGLGVLGVPYSLNHRLVRGLDYYTRTVFEVWAEGIGAQNAVCGGGRYDGLAEELGGRPTPGIGFAMGLERVILTMKDRGMPAPPLPRPRAFVVTLGPQARDEGARLADALRKQDLGVQMPLGKRGLRAQLRQADKAGAAYAIILGEAELHEGKAILKDLASGEQEAVALAQVGAWLQRRLG